MMGLDGGGIVADEPLPQHCRMRVHLEADHDEQDVCVYVADGQLHVVGLVATVHAERIAPNHLALSSVVPAPRRR
jgi:hypothetical protein